MSAAVLREAAALLRSRAEAATPGPWEAGLYWVSAAEAYNPVADSCYTSEDATYIASMHPPVALAMAAQLEAMAAVVVEAADGPLALVAAGLAETSVNLANTYLGRTA